MAEPEGRHDRAGAGELRLAKDEREHGDVQIHGGDTQDLAAFVGQVTQQRSEDQRRVVLPAIGREGGRKIDVEGERFHSMRKGLADSIYHHISPRRRIAGEEGHED